MKWTDQMLELAERLWGDGQSATEVSKALNRTFDLHLSRNAVIGALHRQNWKRVGQVMPKKVRPDLTAPALRNAPAPLRVIAPTNQVAPVPREVPRLKPRSRPYTGPKSILLRASSECPFILSGSGENTLMCCRPIEREHYCKIHGAICYQPRVSTAARVASKASVSPIRGVA